MDIRYSHMLADSYVDGPGRRAVIFFQGCPLACSGCQNTQLWPAEGGKVADHHELAAALVELAGPAGNITISGGEPFSQPAGLAFLVRQLRQYGARHILIYSGYTFEQLINPLSGAYLWVKEILSRIDILVDGPFVKSQDHNLINWRGSANQRPIDVPASLQAERLVILDWDAPRILVTPQGAILAPIGMQPVLDSVGAVQSTRRCGQTK